MNALDWIRKIRKPGRRPSVLSVSATMPSGEHAASPTPPACPTPQGAESENNPAVGGPGFDLRFRKPARPVTSVSHGSSSPMPLSGLHGSTFRNAL